MINDSMDTDHWIHAESTNIGIIYAESYALQYLSHHKTNHMQS